ncbi:Hypothetical predicted protein [Drosophila guanche]|uniref:Uncharacterized protein n=1 Tax=Drosophila guanche TaxID=7266 RepID=A0A3B0KCP0_DROGU|nr:Hypothetical predicted protein [Drosophila guanche]
MDNKNCIQEHYGHRRQPALGKAMPVTALLLNLNLNDGTGRRNNLQQEQQQQQRVEADDEPPRYFHVTDEPPTPNDEEPPPPPGHYGQEPELAGGSAESKPCLNCLGLGLSSSSAINEMCLRLCGDACRQPQGLSLGGHQNCAESQRLRQDFLKQYEIAEALAKTSAMTSTVQMRQRLAARDTVPPSSSFTVDYEPPRDLLLYLVR